MTKASKSQGQAGLSVQSDSRCPSCGSLDVSLFYEVRNVPVHSVLLMPSQEEALNYTRGDISLGHCQACGFITNLAFDPGLLEYSPSYEETQGFSPTFNSFHHRLATRLIERYDLHNKDIIEIGCGKGEFLTLLCHMGGNRGVGFDPAYVAERNPVATQDRVSFMQDFYSEKYASYYADFICCKMTLEHISNTADFVSSVRNCIGNRSSTVVFFQVPSIVRILNELAFWDIYYEHCSYFSPGSLARLFRKCGFDILDLATEYDDQYVTIEARPVVSTGGAPLPEEGDLTQLASGVAFFAKNYRSKLEQWQAYIQQIKRSARRAVIWGAGSKGVAFLTTLDIHDEIAYAVDINPHKHGTYLAGTGHEIVGPDFLREYRPDVVIVMNPIYRADIEQDLNQMDLTPEIVTL